MLQAQSVLRWLSGVLVMLCFAPYGHTQNIEIEVTGIRSGRGQIIIEVYTDHDSFRKEQPLRRETFPKREIINGTMKVELDLKEGTYGLALIDDENRNSEMDYKIIRTAKEGFAFSDFYLEGLKKPDFDDFKFTVEKGEKRKVVMKIRYM